MTQQEAQPLPHSKCSTITPFRLTPLFKEKKKEKKKKKKKKRKIIGKLPPDPGFKAAQSTAFLPDHHCPTSDSTFLLEMLSSMFLGLNLTFLSSCSGFLRSVIYSLQLSKGMEYN